MPEIKELKRAGGKSVATCAFCGGTGKDPFGLLSKLSKCQVCGGRGEVSLAAPAIECAFCGGTGIERNKRITCLVCEGKGRVTAPKDAVKCPSCDGKGHVHGYYLTCTECGGTGVVSKQHAALHPAGTKQVGAPKAKARKKAKSK